jgi:hypothetical protein
MGTRFYIAIDSVVSPTILVEIIITLIFYSKRMDSGLIGRMNII